MRGSAKRRAYAALVLGFAGIIICGVLCFLNTRALLSTGIMSLRARNADDDIEGAQTSLVEAEAAARAYVITGDDEQRKFQNAAAGRVYGHLDRVRKLTSGDPQQQQYLDRLQVLAQQRIGALNQLMATRGPHGADLERAAALMREGSEQMDSLRQLLTQMDREEDRQRVARMQVRAQETRRAVLTWVVGTLLSLAVLALLFDFLRREITEREQAEEKLQAAHAELEAHVRERTADLALANQNLRNEVAKHEQTERTLAEERKYLEAVLFNLDDGIVACNSEGTIKLSNPAVRALRGLAEGAVPLNEWIQPEYMYQADGRTPMATHPLLRALKGEQFRDWEIVISKPPRGPRYLLVNGQPITDHDGKNLGAVIAIRDISERRTLQEQLTQSQKMEAIGQLAGGIAHDFNNLLTIISGYAELLTENSVLDTSTEPLVAEIQKAAARAAALTRQLLTFSRKQILAPRILDLNDVIEGMHKMLRRVIGEDIDLVTVQQPGLGTVRADPNQMEQVILNLAINSRDAMPKGGRLTIETANVEIDEAYTRTHAEISPGPYVMLAVSDTGCGMDATVQKRIFEPFFTTKEKGKGTGLGLATVYGIVKQSGGHVWVYSEPDRGSAFKIYIPRVPVEEPGLRSEESAGQLSARGTETILIVEDEDVVRDLVTKVLRSQGYSVLAANGGEAAITLSNQHPGKVHLIVTDVIMPKMSGRELAQQLQPLRPNAGVLYISGYTDGAIVHHGVLEAGAAFLQKPFTPDALLRKVREVLDAQQA